MAILEYLLSTADCSCIVGLSLVPSVDGRRIALQKHVPPQRTPQKHKHKKRAYQKLNAAIETPSLLAHTLLDEVTEDLFAGFDANAVSLKRLSLDVRNLLLGKGCQTLNLVQLQPHHIVTYLTASSYARISASGQTISGDQID